MNRVVWLIGALAVGTSLMGCNGADPTAPARNAKATQATGSNLTVEGKVAHHNPAEKTRAVAIGEDGRMFWAHLDKHGEFTLRVPLGQSYRVVIANERVGAKGQTVVGHLLLTTAKGRTPWLRAKDASVVNLGTLKPATAGGLSIKCSGCDDADDDDDDDADHSDDSETHASGGGGTAPSSAGAAPAGGAAGGDGDDDDDDDADCDLCGSGGSGAYVPSKPPNPKVCDDDDDDDDDDVDVGDAKTCG